MADFGVNTKFTGIDGITKHFLRMAKGADKFGDESSKAFRRASKSGSRFGDIVKGILVTDVLKGSLRGLTTGLKIAGGEFIAYDAAIVGATARFKGLNTATAEGAAQLAAMKTQARELGATTEFTAGQAAEGLEFLALAGFNVTQSMATLPGVVDLATAASTDLARATDIASDSLGAFGLVTEDTAQLTANMARINDVFAKTTSTANTNMEALFESVVKGGPAFTAAGQSVESFAALTGALANAGVKGSEAGTQLRNTMLRLANPANDAAKIMRKLGINIKDQQGNFRDVIDILGDFEKGTKGMGDVQKQAALSTVFGTRAITGINILLKQGTDSLRDYRQSLIDSGGASKTMADKIRGSLGNQLASLKSAAIELGFKFIDTFEGKIGPAIQRATEFVRGFDLKGMIDQITALVPIVQGLVAGFVAFQSILVIGRVISAVSAFIAFSKALRAAAAAQGILNVVMSANPLGLLAAAVGLLATVAIPLLINGWDDVVKAVSASIDFLLAPLKLAASVISTLTGIGGGEAEKAAPVASEPPNRQALRAQRIQFEGRLDIAGAPEGSEVQSQTLGAPPLRVELAGVN